MTPIIILQHSAYYLLFTGVAFSDSAPDTGTVQNRSPSVPGWSPGSASDTSSQS